jgi:glutaredoxin
MRLLVFVLVCAALVFGYVLLGGGPAQPGSAAEAPSVAPQAARASGPRTELAPETGSAPGTFVYWQYVDSSGSVRFAAHREDVPEAWRERAGRVEMSSPPPTTRAEARAARERQALSARTRPASSAAANPAPTGPASPPSSLPEVQIYTTRSCGYCRAALAYMDRKGIPYVNHDVEQDEGARAEALEKTGGRPGVPVIDVAGSIMQGWNQRAFDSLLAAAR